jgi:CNT family concentrative nucleoside transporter
MLRLIIGGAALVLGGVTVLLANSLSPLIRGAIGIPVFILICVAFSTDVRAINWRTVGWGIVMQVALALLILKFSIGGWRPGFELFVWMGDIVERFMDFTNEGSKFVFGGLADPAVMEKVFPGGFVFAFVALPTIIFVSSFFTVLYYIGILQVIVRWSAKAMMYFMQTSGAETLAAVANVFMGQTEAPIIVKPYVPGMTLSEMNCLMVGGLATISGGVMAVYIALGADSVAILTTSVMAAPATLYLAKILVPETEVPETTGNATMHVENPHANIVDAAAAGASEGTVLAINVAAMIIAFLAFIAMFDYMLAAAWPGMTLSIVFAKIFAPAAILMGVPMPDVPAVADLLGVKLVANEFVAYVKMTTQYRASLTPESYTLATYALTGFANFASIGILIGGIGAMAPGRRGDVARLGGRALLAGFVATLINASIAAMML